MELKAGHKQTEVGIIPEDWDAVQIRDVCRLVNGRGFKPHEWRTVGLPIIRIQNLNGSDDFNFYAGQYNPKILVEHGQLLFAWSGSRGTSFGPHVWNGGRALLNYHTWKVVVNESNVTPDFLLHALRQLTSYIEDRAHGASALVHTQKWEMEKFPVVMPKSLPEQRAIATALSDVDGLLGGLDRLIAKKRDLKQAAMQQLLTGQTRLPGFHGEWRPKKLGELLKYERPDKFLVNSAEYLEKGDIPVLTANKSFILGYTNDDFGIYENLPAIIFDDFTTDSKYVDFPFKVKSSAIKILKARGADVNLQFIFARMRLVDFPLGEHKRYYISEYQHIELPMPEPDEQTAIASVLTEMDAELVALEQRREKTRALKQAMMQELLTGRTRLV